MCDLILNHNTKSLNIASLHINRYITSGFFLMRNFTCKWKTRNDCCGCTETVTTGWLTKWIAWLCTYVRTHIVVLLLTTTTTISTTTIITINTILHNTQMKIPWLTKIMTTKQRNPCKKKNKNPKEKLNFSCFVNPHTLTHTHTHL